MRLALRGQHDARGRRLLSLPGTDRRNAFALQGMAIVKRLSLGSCGGVVVGVTIFGTTFRSRGAPSYCPLPSSRAGNVRACVRVGDHAPTAESIRTVHSFGRYLSTDAMMGAGLFAPLA